MSKRFLLAASLLLAFTGSAAAQTESKPVEIKVGPADVAGVVSFVLSTSSSGDVLAVEAVVDTVPLSAADKGAVVAAAVAAADPTGTWAATGEAGTLSFYHLVGEAWEMVDVISNFSDTTGAGTKVESTDSAVSFTLSMDETAVAVGYDAMGEPSYVTVSVTDTLAWTKALQGGETASSLLDSFQAFLVGEAGQGVEVVRNSAGSLTIILRYEESAVNWQVTDLGLESGSTGEAAQIGYQGMLIRRGR
jgi:hypothetical protein